MGEDRTTVCVDKRTNQSEVMTVRHRNPSSVISSSCSEDAENESVGHIEDEDREQELEYGPGIVSKLKTRFMCISLKQNRGAGMRRSCSMENLLEQERPNGEERGFVNNLQKNGNPVSIIPSSNWGHLKRAKSMDTLLLELEAESCQQQEDCVITTCKSGIRKRELGRTMPTICDEELPKPDTVKTYKRMFEPAESKRGSHCRKPPVLRASAKSGALSGSAKTNGINVSAKSSVLVTKNKFISAKQSNNVIKAHPVANTPVSAPQKVLMNGYNAAKPFVNGDNQVKLILSKQEKQFVNKDNKVKNLLNGEIKEKSLVNGVRGTDHQPICNGKIDTKSSEVKSQSVNNIGHSLCNGKSVEQELNSLNSNSKKEVYFAQVKDVICSRSQIKKDPIKVVSKEEIMTHKKEAVKETNKEVVTLKKDLIKAASKEETVIQSKSKMPAHHLEGQNYKPKVPPNKPTILKNLKSNLKPMEPKKPVVNEKKPISPIKLKNKLETASDSTKCKPVLNGKILDSSKSEKEETEILEINNHKNVESPAVNKSATAEAEFIKPEKQPVKLVEEIAQEHKTDVVDSSKPLNDSKLDSPEIKKEKPSLAIAAPKKVQGSGNSNVAATSMVFDFRGKDVVPQVALLPVPFGCKALHPKKRPLLIDGKSAGESFTNGLVEDDTDEEFVDYSVPPPSGVVFEGENVKVGRGSILATRNKDLKIKFDDEVDNNTFVYPSEVSLLEDSERSESPAPADKEIIPNGQPPASKLKSNTSIGSSGVGGFSSYTPSVLRTMDNFQPGMFRPAPQLPVEEEKGRTTEGEEENTEVREKEENMLKPADPDLISSWSLSAGTSDLLF